MILDAVAPSLVDGIDSEDITFVVIGIIIIACIIGVILYLKNKKGKKVENEKK